MLDEEDGLAFEQLLVELVERTGWELYAWVLMSNHYHLVFSVWSESFNRLEINVYLRFLKLNSQHFFLAQASYSL